ncbi:MAG: sigma-70 family RNA polymerase sigma factor, partial [Planctomycetota bacterium]
MDERTRQAFTLWTQAQPTVSAYIHALVGDRGVRDEVLQEVALAILEHFASYDPARPFLPWAMTNARNKVADARRRGRRTPSQLSEATESALAAALAEVSDTERARLAHLTACLEKVEGRAREICDYRYRAGLAPARIATL